MFDILVIASVCRVCRYNAGSVVHNLRCRDAMCMVSYLNCGFSPIGKPPYVSQILANKIFSKLATATNFEELVSYYFHHISIFPRRTTPQPPVGQRIQVFIQSNNNFDHDMKIIF